MASLKERLLNKSAAVESKNIEVTEAHKVEVETPKKSVRITPKKDVEPEIEEYDDDEVEVEVRPKATKKTAEPKEAKEAPAPKKLAKEKEPKVAVKKLTYPDTWSLDAELDAIDAAIEATDSHMMLAKAIAFYNTTATDIQALLLESYANNGGAVALADMKKAYAEYNGKRATERNDKKLLSLYEKGGYTAEQIIGLIPESEDEAYTLLLFTENGWNNMGGLSIKGKAREALSRYFKNFEEVEA